MDRQEGLSEQELIAMARKGDKAAFGELVRLHRRGVFAVVYRLCGDAALAEDAAQEAFVRAWVNLHTYVPRSPWRNWLYRIAANVALDRLRSDNRRLARTVSLDADGDELAADQDGEPTRDSPCLAAASEDGPAAQAERQELAEQVRLTVLALPPASRAVLVLREYEDFSYREIADALDIPLGTVMSRLNYARGVLRQRLAPLMEER
jgi:RNA polymerase sigma-70 factor (ECF subfamily)